MSDDNKPKLGLPELEEEILEFWARNKIFQKSLDQTKRGKNFIFYEGPPTANGPPGVHHAETRAFKDIILRYKTMRGFYVPRKAGWDTHGLPVEIEVEKELGLKSKRDIEKYGIGKFNQKAKESVWKYKDEWEKSTQRLGFWLDLDNPYITYQTPYIESLWRIIKEFWEKGLLYQDFKSLPWCPRCGTGLSSHEVGLGYKKVKDASVYVKLKIRGKPKEYLLVWTTTPWTLPANVAVAVNPKIEYSKFKINGDYIWSAKTPPYENNQSASVVEKISGNQLAGFEYEPLFPVPKDYSIGTKPPHRIFPADFVSTAEGTGMVHIAPAFGEEDLNLVKSKIQNPKSKTVIGYPILQTVNPDGTMKKGIIGEGKFVKDADKDIMEDLSRRGLLLKFVPYEHDYPFCWRCQTPLLYYAKTAWWVRVSALKEKLLLNNEKINWIPEHIKHGRFGEFLREVRDWAFSRERFWGTPLPIWQCQTGKSKIQNPRPEWARLAQQSWAAKSKIQNYQRNGCGNLEVIGSREEFAERAGKQNNRYFIMRHGEALSNVKNVVTYAPDGKYRETLKGRTQVERAAKKLKKEKIDLIFSSDVLRTKESADIAAEALGVKKVNTDSRLREIHTGIFGGRKPEEYHAFFSGPLEKFTKRPPEGETLTELRKRMMDFLQDLEKKYSGKTILIVSHEYPLWMLYAGALGLSNEETIALRAGKWAHDFIGFAEVMGLIYRKLPRDENMEVDLHRPYVDDFEFPCKKCGGAMRRVQEVADVWFDSGSMPWASSQRLSAAPYPADYICEAVDQTRGWFYTLLAVATLLGKGAPYKNVISLGHVLDKNGQKMSKSKGNVIDPKEMMQKYGADALRWYFYTINQPGEPKRFDEKDLFGKLRGFLMTFYNSFIFFDTYVDKIQNTKSKIQNKLKTQNSKPKNVLDQWIMVRFNQLVADATKCLDKYDITGTAREIENFVINDFSQWYLRRSRRRFQKPESKREKDEAARTTAYVLLTLCRILAPFTPFLTETIYQELRKKLRLKEMSIHLASWPKVEARNKKQEARLIYDMEMVRSIVSEALKLRAEAGIKVRQPLRNLQLSTNNLQQHKELLELVKDEVNVKEITFGNELKLDTELTLELREEGIIREVIRNLQEMRKDLGLYPKDKIRAQFSGALDLDAVLEKWKDLITREAGAKEFVIGGKKEFRAERELEFEGRPLWVGVDNL